MEKAYISLILSLLVIGSLPILLKLGEAGIDPSAVIFGRVWIATLLLIIWNSIQVCQQVLPQSLLLLRQSCSDSSRENTSIAA